ncbi:hypothetical protein DB88DRAFT_473461 [Papiliotrema laurentii]|uniref:Uncharacterized protein n=1 Tax=Papiliotrema laurentii TaxID=5418 RepID=A0AAD9D0C0_PAPLA|nr:hypothetical protein DB88DRAFT_473461 [Papiliotrema laurentii]
MATLQPSQEDIDSFVRAKGYTPEKLRTVLDWVGRWGLNALVTQWMYGNASKPLTLGSDHSRFSSRPPTPCFDHPSSGGSLPSGSSNQETPDTPPASSDDGNMPAPQPNGLDQSPVPFWGRTYLVDLFANRSVSSESAVTELSAWSPNLYSEQQWAEGAYLSHVRRRAWVENWLAAVKPHWQTATSLVEEGESRSADTLPPQTPGCSFQGNWGSGHDSTAQRGTFPRMPSWIPRLHLDVEHVLVVTCASVSLRSWCTQYGSRQYYSMIRRPCASCQTIFALLPFPTPRLYLSGLFWLLSRAGNGYTCPEGKSHAHNRQNPSSKRWL